MYKLFLGFSIFFSISAIAQEEVSIAKLERAVDSVMHQTMETEHIPGAAFIIVKDGKVLLEKGYGYTSLGEEIRRVTPDSTIFRIGSITKTFTATALLQLVDRKKVELHADVNRYLTSLQVPETFTIPVTSFHLLTHSAGFDELRGRVVYREDQRIPLGTFLKDRLVRLREPGVVSSYSSYAIALAGLLVEDMSGNSLEQFMKQNIWSPLGMNMTSMKVFPEEERYASWGYEYRRGINVPQPWEYYHTYPASEIFSTVSDMGKYLIMNLNQGKYEGEMILKQETAKMMQQQQLSVHPEVEGFCLGYYEEYSNGLRTVSHGGDMLGYSSYMAMVPESNLGIFVVHHHEGTRLRYQVVSTILSHFNTASKEQLNILETKNNLAKFAGNYQWTTFCHTCENAWQPEPIEVTLNDDHTITVFDRKLYPVGPLLFKDKEGTRTVGFLEDESGKITYLSSGSSNVFERIE